MVRNMYLCAVRTLSSETPTKMRKINKIVGEIFGINNSQLLSAKFQIGYWNRFIQLNRWFVDNIRDFDENNEIWVSAKDLEKLLQFCQSILSQKSLAENYLPTNHDDSYFNEIERTIEIINSALHVSGDRALPLSGDWYFVYSASW